MSTTGSPRTPTRARRPVVPPLLRETAFRRFFCGQTASLFGDQVSLLAIPLLGVLLLHASAAQMGYLTAAGLLPSLLFSMPVGARLDRRGSHRRTMLAADLGRAALLASIPLAYALGGLGLPQLYLVTFAVGTLDVFFAVAHQSVFVALVRTEDYIAGNSLLNGSRALSFVGGQSAAGLLVAALSAPGAILIDAFSFLGSAFTLARIHPPEPPTPPATESRMAAGVAFIRRSPIMRALLGATATVNYFNFVFFALFVLYATRDLGVRPAELGLVLGLGAVGGLVGATLTGRIARRIGLGRAVVLSCVLFPAPLLAVPAAGGPHLLILGLLFLGEFGSGFGVMLLDITVGSVQAEVIPDRLRSRVQGAYRMVNYGVRPLGALTGGALGTLLGPHTTLWIATLGGLLTVLWVLPGPLRSFTGAAVASGSPAQPGHRGVEQQEPGQREREQRQQPAEGEHQRDAEHQSTRR
ncbi:MAG: MFS transporter [Sciscionella sp.]